MNPIAPDHTLTLTARDGLKLHVAHWRHPRPTGVAVFLHGLCGHAGWYGELAAVLRQAGWAMVGPDYRGHGLSEGPRGGLRQDDDLLYDLATVLDHVHEAFAGLPCVLIGHSCGGLLAARYGVQEDAQRPAPWWRPVAGLVLLAPALQPTLSLTQKALLTTMGRLLLDVAVPTGIDPNWACGDPDTALRLSQDPLMHNRITPRLALFLARDGQRVLDHAAHWRTPTLLLYSKADRLVMAEGCERFARAAPKATTQTRVYPRLAHSFLHETDRAMVHDDITAWLRQRFAT